MRPKRIEPGPGPEWLRDDPPPNLPLVARRGCDLAKGRVLVVRLPAGPNPSPDPQSARGQPCRREEL